MANFCLGGTILRCIIQTKIGILNISVGWYCNGGSENEREYYKMHIFREIYKKR